MIKFIEETHLYLNSNNEAYTSVTTVIKQFEPKKDWDKIKKNYAKKHKMSVDEVTAKWDKVKNDACARGTAYHKFRELDLVANTRTTIDDREITVFPSYCIAGQKLSGSNLQLVEGVYPELIIWLDSAMIAGQADKVIIKDGYIHVQDYKTNKKIDREGFKNWEGKEEKLIFPLDHMPCCNYSIYTLQLSLYMYMLLRHNPTLKAGNMELLHVVFEPDPNNPDEDIVKEVIPIPVPYKKLEVQNIINHLKKRK